jgi:hypothetical protein
MSVRARMGLFPVPAYGYACARSRLGRVGADGNYVLPHEWFAELYASKPFLHADAAENVMIPPLLFLLLALKADLLLFDKV